MKALLSSVKAVREACSWLVRSWRACRRRLRTTPPNATDEISVEIILITMNADCTGFGGDSRAVTSRGWCQASVDGERTDPSICMLRRPCFRRPTLPGISLGLPTAARAGGARSREPVTVFDGRRVGRAARRPARRRVNRHPRRRCGHHPARRDARESPVRQPPHTGAVGAGTGLGDGVIMTIDMLRWKPEYRWWHWNQRKFRQRFLAGRLLPRSPPDGHHRRVLSADQRGCAARPSAHGVYPHAVTRGITGLAP
jgi:hypothetical protein